MPRLRFGAFLAPHHPIGEHPMLQFRRDLDFMEHLDRLGSMSSGAASITRTVGR
jgi:limonene 1,2-monooxygenase